MLHYTTYINHIAIHSCFFYFVLFFFSKHCLAHQIKSMNWRSEVNENKKKKSVEKSKLIEYLTSVAFV